MYLKYFRFKNVDHLKSEGDMEKITEYITDAAFCYIAVTGDDFCVGAFNGFLLLLVLSMAPFFFM